MSVLVTLGIAAAAGGVLKSVGDAKKIKRLQEDATIRYSQAKKTFDLQREETSTILNLYGGRKLDMWKRKPPRRIKFP